MISKEKLTELLTKNYSKLFSVEAILVDEIIAEYSLSIRLDQRDFYIRYGNSLALLTSMFADCTFERFKRYYTKQFPFDEICEEEMLPNGTCYFGHDFADEFLCIENSTGSIYVYAFKEKEAEPYYENIESFLTFAILFHEVNMKLFNRFERGIKIDNLEKFMLENAENKIDGLSTYYYQYYLKENTLIALNYRASCMDIYMGGVLINI